MDTTPGYINFDAMLYRGFKEQALEEQDFEQAAKWRRFERRAMRMEARHKGLCPECKRPLDDAGTS